MSNWHRPLPEQPLDPEEDTWEDRRRRRLAREEDRDPDRDREDQEERYENFNP